MYAYKLSNLPKMYVQIWKLPKLTYNFKALLNFGNSQICTCTFLASCQICTRTFLATCQKCTLLQRHSKLLYKFGNLPEMYAYKLGNLPKMYVQIWKLPKFTTNFKARPYFGNSQICTYKFGNLPKMYMYKFESCQN